MADMCAEASAREHALSSTRAKESATEHACREARESNCWDACCSQLRTLMTLMSLINSAVGCVNHEQMVVSLQMH